MPNSPRETYDFTKTLRKQAQQDCRAEKPDDPYSQFVGSMPKRKRGEGATGDIDNGPSNLGDLAAYFAKLPPERLAHCWVACTIDLVDPDTIGDMARALMVVAERLHGVKFENPVVSPSPLRRNSMPTPNLDLSPRSVREALVPISKATPLVNGQPAEPPAWEIRTGTPPIPVRMGKVNPLKDAIRALQPGQFIVVSKSKIKSSVVVSTTNNLRTVEGRKDLRTYAIANGDRVVIRDAAKS